MESHPAILAVAKICRRIWEGQGQSGQAINLESDRNSFSFSAPKMGYLIIFGFFSFSAENEFSFLFYFSFSFQKCLALGRKFYVRNWTVTNKFCDIGTGDLRFRFSAENSISFSSAFSFTAENEKCIFGRHLHQTVSDYTLRQWFSNTQQSWFRTACRCLDKLVLPSIVGTSLTSFIVIIIVVAYSNWPLRRVPWPMAISDLHSVDSSRALVSSWILLSQTLRGRPGGLLQLAFLPS